MSEPTNLSKAAIFTWEISNLNDSYFSLSWQTEKQTLLHLTVSLILGVSYSQRLAVLTHQFVDDSQALQHMYGGAAEFFKIL